MFYSKLLLFHSYFRWVVVIALIGQFCWILNHYLKGKTFENKDLQYLLLFCMAFNIQFFVGWLLYFQSPLVKHFYQAIPKSIKIREVRFFGLEHMTMMSIAIIWMNVSSFLVRKHIGSPKGFSFLFKRHIWILLFVLGSIPWSFSPFTARPNWR